MDWATPVVLQMAVGVQGVRGSLPGVAYLDVVDPEEAAGRVCECHWAQIERRASVSLNYADSTRTVQKAILSHRMDVTSADGFEGGDKPKESTAIVVTCSQRMMASCHKRRVHLSPYAVSSPYMPCPVPDCQACMTM